MKKQKIYNIKDLVRKLFRYKKKIGLCHGVFDLLHLGHINHFNEAKKKCDILVVSVTEDKFVSKGPGRPVFDQSQRMEALANLEPIDYVVLSNKESAVEVINKIKPKFYFKGPDYKISSHDLTKKINLEKKEVEKYSGKLIVTKSKKYSSSYLINKQYNIFTPEQETLINKIKKKYTYNQVKEIINDFKKTIPLVVGETIIDQYYFCEALGKSGKEPMLVLRDSFNESYLGGAGAICRHVSEFTNKQKFLSIIGEKKENISFIKKNIPKNTSFFLLPKKDSPTILKKRFLDEVTKSKVLGVYSLNSSLISPKEEKKLKINFEKFSKKSNLTILSDYGHGMISKDLRKLFIKKSNFIAVNVQVNAANIGYHTLKNYHSVDFMIINEMELRHEMRSKEKQIMSLIKKLSNDQNIKYLVVTRGLSGAILYEKKTGKFYFTGAFSKNAIDKVGAGDAMLSVMAICLSNKIDLNLSLLISSLSAAQSVNIIGNKESINKAKLLKELDHILT